LPCVRNSTLPLSLIAAAGVLAGCEAQLTVDLTDGPTDTADEVVLAVTHVALQTDTGDVERFAVEDATPVDLLLFRRGQTHRLVTSQDIPNGDYVGIALEYAATGSFVTRNDGSQVTVNTPTVRRFTDIDLSVTDLDSKDLVLALNLRFSLVDTGAGSYDLEPVMRAARPASTGTVTGLIATSAVESTACQAGRTAGEGVAVYAFRGTGATPADFVGQDNLIESDDVAFDAAASAYRYELHFLPAGDYTLALTCQADADDPSDDDVVDFEDTLNVSVTADGTVQANF